MKTYAVDFDGTLHKGFYPYIAEPNVDLIKFLIKARQNGDKVILWTCREGEILEPAIAWCREQGLEFDAVNDNLPEFKLFYQNNVRKIFADVYIDDRAAHPSDFKLSRRGRTHYGKL